MFIILNLGNYKSVGSCWEERLLICFYYSFCCGLNSFIQAKQIHLQTEQRVASTLKHGNLFLPLGIWNIRILIYKYELCNIL